MPQSTPGEIEHAARLLQAGGLVAFPTETVYGLGANALDSKAVGRIYAVKRRPPTSPLIVHVASIKMAQLLVADWPDIAERLTTKFWPGPLTLVLALDHLSKDQQRTPTVRPSAIPYIVTAGLKTVGLRMPAHPMALALIESAGVPVAAPSANRFSELSPTTAAHVKSSLGNEVDFVLDGGPCKVGIESTVLSLVDATPVLLRPGAISRQELEALIGPIASAPEVKPGPHPAPGMHAKHYSPRTTLLLVEKGQVPLTGRGVYLQHTHPPKSTNIGEEITIVEMPQSAPNYAAALYEALHQADTANADWIALDSPPNNAEWEAVQDRLSRAAMKE